ncbi:10922_t:CDS:2, partial [Cetraspora pellucida]
MNIDEQQENIISTIDEQEENITSPNLEIDEESKMESSWSEKVELHSQILSNENQNLEASIPEGNSLIPRMKTPTDPLATMYSISPSQSANLQSKNEDELIYKQQFFKFTNVYAPPNIEDRTIFFNNWASQVDERCINILAGDFNTNLNSQTNRISDSPPTSDPMRETFRRLTSEFIDIAYLKQKKEPFITYYQNTREKLVFKEVLHENSASWNEQVESEIERTKALLTQGHREDQTDMSKDSINTTIDDMYEKQTTTDNMLENKKTTTQSFDNIENNNSNSLFNNIQETNPYINLQEDSAKHETTLNVKGLNDRGKQQNSLILL